MLPILKSESNWFGIVAAPYTRTAISAFCKYAQHAAITTLICNEHEKDSERRGEAVVGFAIETHRILGMYRIHILFSFSLVRHLTRIL